MSEYGKGVDFAKLMECSNSIKKTRDEIENIKISLQPINSKIGLDGEVWGGDTSEEAKQLFDKLLKLLDETVSIINEDSQYIDRKIENYKNWNDKYSAPFKTTSL